MSDDVAALTNVEEEAPAAAPAADPAAPPAAPVEEPAAAEVDAVEVGGQKYVPLAAVLAERREKHALKDRAARADQLEAAVAEMRPYVEFLRQNPGLTQRQAPTPSAPAAPEADPDVEQVARDFDLYTPDGKPDLPRAARIHARQQTAARQAAADAVRPVQQQSAQQQSAVNLRMAMSAQMPAGVHLDPAALQTFWQALPPDLTADPNVAALVTLLAAGAGALKGPVARVAPPAHPPLVTETPGGGAPARQPLTGMSRKIAAARGIDEAKYQKLTEGFRPGRTNVLEED